MFDADLSNEMKRLREDAKAKADPLVLKDTRERLNQILLRVRSSDVVSS